MNDLQHRLLANISSVSSPRELEQLAAALKGVWLSAAMGAAPTDLSALVSNVADAITRRLLQLAEIKFGTSPVPYAWIAYGSQGRHELTLNSDQDNALVLSNNFDPEQHDNYFAALTHFVCDELANCGFIHCPGQMMASTRRWRMPQNDWQALFSGWTQACDAHEARLASNFFDLRRIAGPTELTQPLLESIAHGCAHHDALLAQWVANANCSEPALGLFRRFLTDDQDRLDLKHSAIIPIVELARIHCLSAGLNATGTAERLNLAAGRRWLSRRGAEELIDTWHFVLRLRVAQQRSALMTGLPADNFIRPEQLTASEQERLRLGLHTIDTQQRALLQIFPYLPTH